MIKLSFKSALLVSISVLIAVAVGTAKDLSDVNQRDILTSNIYHNSQQRVILEPIDSKT